MFVPTICQPVNCPAPCEGGVADAEASRGPSRTHEEESTELRDAHPVGKHGASPKKGHCQDGSGTSAFSHITREALEAGKRAASASPSPSSRESPHQRAKEARTFRRKPTTPIVLHLDPARLGAKGAKAIEVLKELVQESLETQADEEKAKRKQEVGAGSNLGNGASSPKLGGNTANMTADSQKQLASGSQTSGQSQSQGQTGASEDAEKEWEWKPPTWKMEEAFSESLGRVVVQVFKAALNLQDADEATAARHLGKLEPGELSRMLKELLVTGECASKLSVELGKQLGSIAQAEALTGDEMNAKFTMCPDEKFEMVFGDKATYLQGLEPRIGLPSAKTLQAIVEEHCRAQDSNIPWTTGNYGVTTTSCEELLIVLKTMFEEFEVLKQQLQQHQQHLQQLQQQQQQQGLLQTLQLHKQRDPIENIEEDLWKPIEASMEELRNLVKDFDLTQVDWKAETTNDDHPRATCRSKNLLLAVMEKNRQLRALGSRHQLLRLEEALLCNLYTGPLFEKYNQVHRGGSLTGDNNAYMEKRFLELCHGNRYTTSQFVLTSGMIKLSVLSKTAELYRGVGKGLLPEQFWRPNAFGSRGGVELGFMSATTDRSVACQYASGSAIQTVFEMSTGMIDNGAELAWISQYPHEREICFPPLTALEVVKTRCDGAQLCVSLRLNLNLTNDTIEKVVGKRKQVIHALCSSLQQEARQFLSGPNPLWQRLFENVTPAVQPDQLATMKALALELCTEDLARIQEVGPEVWNNDARFLEGVQDCLNYTSSAKCCSTRVLLKIADTLDNKQGGVVAQPTWSHSIADMADHLLEDDMELKRMEIEGAYQKLALPELSAAAGDIEWVFNALGFKKWHFLCAEAGPGFTWKDSQGQELLSLPGRAGVVLPENCILVELEGCRDLMEGAWRLRKRWAQSVQRPFVTKLSARFGIAVLRPATELRSFWYKRKSDGEAAAVRLERAWTKWQPTSLSEEWLETKSLGDQGSKNWGAAFRDAAAAGVIPINRSLRLCESNVLHVGCEDLCVGLASCTELEELDIGGANLTSKFAKSFLDSVINLVNDGQRPFRNLQVLALDGNTTLGKKLTWPDAFAQSLVFCSSLEVLSLVDCGLDASFATALGAVLLASSNRNGGNKGIDNIDNNNNNNNSSSSSNINNISPTSRSGTGCRRRCCNWPALKELRLHGNDKLGVDLQDPSTFVRGLATLPVIQVLFLGKCGLNSCFAATVGTTILDTARGGRICWPELHTLRFCFNDQLSVGLRDPRSYAMGLASLPKLKVLNLVDSGIDSSLATALASSFLQKSLASDEGRKHWPKLTRVTFQENPNLGTGLRDPSLFVRWLVALRDLEALSLEWCDLDSSFAMTLGATILQNKADTSEESAGCWTKLRVLSLHRNRRFGANLDDPSVLIQSLMAVSGLEILELAECGLKDTFADAFLSALSVGPAVGHQQLTLPKLTRLRMNENLFSDEVVTKLEKFFLEERPDVYVDLHDQVKPPKSWSIGQRCCTALCLRSQT